MAKRTYYNISNLLKTNAQWLMLLGQRANGKSYQVKKTVLEDAYKGKGYFVYLRRYKADLKQSFVTAYFEDMPISKITNGEYDTVRAINGSIYFVALDETGDTSNRKLIGRYCALNEAVRYKSQVFKDYTSIVYEEFITDDIYLNDEPRLLQQFVSTVARLDKIRVFLVGNTLSRVCPYFSEWCLEGVLKQKQGTIELYHYHTEQDITVTIAVEYCANTNNENAMFFGQSAKQIITGEWDVKELPKLPRAQYEYEKLYEVKLIYQSFKFCIELLVEPNDGGLLLFVYPLTTDRKIYRIITDTFSDLPNVTSRLDKDRKAELLMIKCFMLNKICFSDNLTGSDFYKVLDKMKLY